MWCSLVDRLPACVVNSLGRKGMESLSPQLNPQYQRRLSNPSATNASGVAFELQELVRYIGIYRVQGLPVHIAALVAPRAQVEKVGLSMQLAE